MNRGDKVYLQPGTGTSNLNNLGIFGLGQEKSSFGGFLLHEFDEQSRYLKNGLWIKSGRMIWTGGDWTG